MHSDLVDILLVNSTMLPISVSVLPSFPSLQSHRYDNQVLHEWILKWKLLFYCYNTDFTERRSWQKVDVFCEH